MALLVFLQFFSRYVLNDSYAWTEELAVYCLIGVVFIGSAMCVRACRHIQVDFLYRYLPRPVELDAEAARLRLSCQVRIAQAEDFVRALPSAVSVSTRLDAGRWRISAR